MKRLSHTRRQAVAGGGFIIVGAIFIQWSAAVITPVFRSIGPSAASAWRFAFGAIVLVAVTRPRIRAWTRPQWGGVIVLGVATAFMNQCFYQAIARIPLGTAVAIEYLGPFLVAALGKRTPRHFAFLVLGALGVLALTRPGGGITLVGALFAAGSGLGWAVYALASHRVGGVTRGFSGLAVAMSISALVTVPYAAGATSQLVSDPANVARVAVVAVMAIVIGFGAEMQALRRVKPSIVSVLLALDPAVAFGVGWLLMGQKLTGFDALGLICVVVAGVGVTTDVVDSDVGLAL